MKKLAILAAALFATGAARVQAQTAPTPPTTNPAAYSQDSYITQSGAGNTATVNQTDGRASSTDGGGTANVSQSGNNNMAFQTQVLSNTGLSNIPVAASPTSRNFMGVIQDGSLSTVTQVQNVGGYNTMNANQGVGTTNHRAVQTQIVDGTGFGDRNTAVINQNGPATGNYNYAEQTQSGTSESAQIDQQGSKSYAKQTQIGGSTDNSAFIGQGDPGSRNTAIQSQTGTSNTSSIQQSRFAGNAGSDNYASQTQTGILNNAKITQNSSKNSAVQEQSGMDNFSGITQSVVTSLAHTIQSGTSNTATVVQGGSLNQLILIPMGPK